MNCIPPTRSLPSTTLLLVLSLAIFFPGAALAGKGPSKKDVDEALLRLSDEQMHPAEVAEEAARAAEKLVRNVEAELSYSKLDQQAAKSWVDAAGAVLRAIEISEKAAKAANRIQELSELAGRNVQGEASLAWREAQLKSSKQKVTYLGVRLGWAKSDLSRQQVAANLARLQTFKSEVQASPELDEEIGKVTKQLGKAGGAAERDRGKMDKAERSWEELDARARELQPR